jgi:hypothetical protein
VIETITVTQRRGNRKMLYLFEQYKAAHPGEGDEIKPHLVAPWAITQGLWKRPPMEAEEVLRRLLSRALRNEYIVDPQGREVRKHHPVISEVKTAEGIKKQSTWYTIFDAPPEKMRASLQLRRRAALADVMQLKFDFDSYNENNRQGGSLAPMDFDFNKDIDELSQPVTYPNEAPNEGDDDDETEEDRVL